MRTILFILLRIIFYLIVIHGIHKTILWGQEKFTKPKKRIIAINNNIYQEVEEKINNNLNNTQQTINNQNNPFITNNNTINSETNNIINNLNNEEKTTPIDQLPIVEPDMKEELKNFLKSTTYSA